MALLIQETWVNRTMGHGIGESGKYEPFTENVTTLYKSLLKEYGRCQSKVYIDRTPTDYKSNKGKVKAIGWVFQKRVKYEDSKDTYLQETWVTLYSAPDDVKTTVHYHFLKN